VPAHGGEGRGQRRLDERRPLAAHPHGQAQALGGLTQDGVDVGRVGVPAGHAGQDHGGGQAATEQLATEVDAGR
jgi:hypothetical protein